MSNQITCKKTGEGLAMLTGGGTCRCPSAKECQVYPAKVLSATDCAWNAVIEAAALAAETPTPRGMCSECFEEGQTLAAEAIRKLKRMPS